MEARGIFASFAIVLIRLFILSFCVLSLPAFAQKVLPIRPDDYLTPGEIITNDTTVLCKSGYSRTVRHTSGKLKHLVYQAYSIDKPDFNGEIDHRVPLALGGADTFANLWPESYDTEPFNAHDKDVLEWYMHKEVCSGRMSIADAQAAFLGDWTEAYSRHFQ